jgi:hypothetical protein
VLLSIEPSIRLQLTGSSMEPLLSRGQHVVCRHRNRLISGNCYFFRYHHRVLLHRLVSVKDTMALFMGDNSDSVEWVDFRDILAELDDTTQQLYKLSTVIINRICLLGAEWFPFPITRGIMRLRRKVLGSMYRCTSFLRKGGVVMNRRRGRL